MADFKIKSAAGTGNKTLIQGQDQSGSNYAIEIGDAGALKLGTVTAWTAPAGTIIQTVCAKKNDEDSAGETGTTFTRVKDGSTNYEWRATISNLQTNSDVIITACFTASFADNDSTSAGGGLGFFRDDDAGGTNLVAITTPSVNEHWANYDGVSSSNHYQQLQLTWIDESPTQTAHTYYLGCVANSGSTVNIRSSSGNMPFIMILQELKK